jgi:hypothetical protein
MKFVMLLLSSLGFENENDNFGIFNKKDDEKIISSLMHVN